jgi:hypothetical protein
MPTLPDGVDVIRVDPGACRNIWRERGEKGGAFDYKAALVVTALREGKLPSPCLVLDVDATVHANLETHFSWWDAHAIQFAMPVDPGGRTIEIDDTSQPEWSSHALYFGADYREHDYSGEYRKAWLDLKWLRTEAIDSLRTSLREQRAWSVVCRRTGGRVLDKRFCWSPRFHGPVSEPTIICHRHGDQKWEGL